MSDSIPVRDKYVEKILIATCLKPMTAFGVPKVFGIPVVICHRKIKLLEGPGLVTCAQRIVTEDKGTVKFYRANEDSVEVAKGNGRYVVRINVPPSIALDISIGRRDFA